MTPPNPPRPLPPLSAGLWHDSLSLNSLVALSPTPRSFSPQRGSPRLRLSFRPPRHFFCAWRNHRPCPPKAVVRLRTLPTSPSRPSTKSSAHVQPQRPPSLKRACPGSGVPAHFQAPLTQPWRLTQRENWVWALFLVVTGKLRPHLCCDSTPPTRWVGGRAKVGGMGGCVGRPPRVGFSRGDAHAGRGVALSAPDCTAEQDYKACQRARVGEFSS